MMKMVPHNHHHRPLSPFDNDSCAGAGDGDGPTTCSVSVSIYNNNNNNMTHHHHHNINDLVSGGSASPAVSAAAIHSGGAAVRTLQPFDISTFKSPGAMAASLGFPFTNAQWKELERQAMIYKYMMASVPVPHNLLIPTALTSASCSPCIFDNGFNLRLASSSTDPEPGRCRRTDGKKWRCSRDVAPNHKYCERHMHRGRPRSRKPVEVQTDGTTTTTDNNQQNKRARQDFHQPYPASAAAVAVSNPMITDGGSSSSQFLQSTASQAFHESSLSLDKYGVKTTNLGSLASMPSDSQPRGLDWMLKGDPNSMAASDQEWQTIMQAKADLMKQSSCNNNNATISSYEDALYLSSYSSFNPGLDQQNRRCSLFLNPLLPMENPESLKPRGFIDAWSNAETMENSNGNVRKSPVSSNAKLSLSSLDLSMGGGPMVDEEMDSIHMGLGLMEPDGDTENGNKAHLSNWLTPAALWAGSTPGGPLAEVLRPSAVAPADTGAASGPQSPVITNAESGSPLATMMSSPSGVLQRTLGSMSDCSSNSSPTVASSRANSEVALLLFNKAN